jgi:hypothetical protein
MVEKSIEPEPILKTDLLVDSKIHEIETYNTVLTSLEVEYKESCLHLMKNARIM